MRGNQPNTARPLPLVAAADEHAGDEHAGQQGGKAVGQRHRRQHPAAHGRTDGEHEPLAHPVGQHAPGVDRGHRAQAEGGEHGGDLDQAQPEGRLERRSQRRKAALDRCHRGSRGGAEGQNGPAV